MTDDMVTYQGCYAEFPAQVFREAPCSECSAVCHACIAGANDVRCIPCFDAQLPWLAAYIRRCIAAKLN